MRVPRPLRPAREFVQRVIRDSSRHDLPGSAAKMAYFSFLSIFPAMLVLFALTGFVGGDAAFQRIAALVRGAVPMAAWQFLEGFLQETVARPRSGIISIGAVILVWAASSGIAAFMYTLNEINGLEERRGWIKRRLLALATFLATALLIVGAAALVIAGMRAVEGAGLGGVWRVVRWPVILLVATGAIWLAYYYLPSRERRGGARQALIGAVLATTLWALVTFGFGFYMSYVRDYTQVYGGVGAVVALLIWCYLSALSVLIGAEVAVVLERGGGKT